MTMMTSAPSSAPNPASSTSTELFRGFSSISSRLTTSLKESGVGANFENLISGVKNFLPADRDLTVTKITESIMDPAGASSSAIAKTENYLYFDPRSANARGTMPPPSAARRGGDQMPGGIGTGMGMGASSSSTPGTTATFGQRRQGYSEAIVFTVGGGSMDEYGNLREWAERTGAGAEKGGSAGGRRRVVYGSTELVNAEQFLELELDRLGAEAAS